MFMKQSRIYISLCLFFAILFILAGCGAGKTMVLRPPEVALKVSSIDISEGKSTVNVPDNVRKLFEAKLTEFLYQEGSFKKGSDLKIQYRFIQFNPGSQFTRWFWGGIGNAGEGTMTVEAKYFDKDNNELCVIHSEGKIGSGAFGGSFDFAVEKTAQEIAEYTKQNFK